MGRDPDDLEALTRDVAHAVVGNTSAKLVDRRAADLVNIKLANCGGLRAARHLLAVAEAAGIGVVFGSMLETHVGTAAASSLAPAADRPLTPDLDAAWWLARSPVQGGMACDCAAIARADSPGLGITGPAEGVEQDGVQPLGGP
jgi:L-alanine-DL-glutamate epimerase-like enolase superfamily enzyme